MTRPCPITPAPSPPLVLETFSAEEDDEPFEEVQVEGVQVPDGDTLAERVVKNMAEPAAACARLEEDFDGERSVEVVWCLPPTKLSMTCEDMGRS